MAERDAGAEMADNRNTREEPNSVRDEQIQGGNGTLNDRETKAPEVHSPIGSKSEKVSTGHNVEEKRRPSKVKELWGKLGLDMGTVMMMFK